MVVEIQCTCTFPAANSPTGKYFQALALTLVTAFILGPHSGYAQRSFPPLSNVAVERPVSTTPAVSTCGMNTRNAYCLSSTSADSINRCTQGYCVQTCPGRTSTPTPSRMLTATSPGFGSCVITDTVNTRPGTPSGEYSMSLVSSGPTCYLSPAASPRLDGSGVVSFTITSWLWLESEGQGTLLEKEANSGRVLFTFRVGATGVSLVYSTLDQDSITTFIDAAIPLKTWTHISIQIHDTSCSVFVNGPGPDLSAAETVKLVITVPDDSGTYRVGQSVNGDSQYSGRIQDLFFFTTALSNREILELYSATFQEVRIQPDCRCQGLYPRVKPSQTHFCIKNGDLPDTDDVALRISRDAHPLQYINDGDSNSRWISSFQNAVDIDIDLGDQFQVFYVVLQFYSSFPKAVTISRQKDATSAFEVWQYYADDCSRFGLGNNGGYSSPSSVNCLQFGTNGAPIPYSLGNITFNLLAPDPVARPGSNDFYNTPELHEFVRATKIRLSFEDHYYVTNIRHLYYSLYESIVTAWCDCNGHSSVCDSKKLPYTCMCLESSNTEGARCEQCKPLYNDKPFRKGDNVNPYPCKPCQCFNHSESCVYNADIDDFPDSYEEGGGGVCVDCQHFTTGTSCESCIQDYYRPHRVSLYDPEVCQPCDCFTPGLAEGSSLSCEEVGGQCTCKENVERRRCDACKTGFYKLEDSNVAGCLPCTCHPSGVVSGDISCDQLTGQCNCKANTQGIQCGECEFGFFGLTEDDPDGCRPCDCNPFGSTSVFCDPDSGQCQCKDRVEGLKCEVCKDNFFNFTSGCDPCNCNVSGIATDTVCDKATGQCMCKKNVEGLYCDVCKEGTYKFGFSQSFGCENCPCFVAGTINGTGSCDPITGDCFCKENVEGQGCDRCKPNTWGLTETDPQGCRSCGCDPTGTLTEDVSICDQNTGQCSCLSNRHGQKCDTCVDGFFINPEGGCHACDCNPTGSIQGTFCNRSTGQCQCKGGDFGVSGISCDECSPTYYKFSARLGFCTPCNCLEAGSVNDSCNTNTGQCQCKTLVQGRQCDRCVQGSSLLDADNPFGCSTTPSQQPPPDHDRKTPTSLRVFWGPPDFPNGIISSYNLFRNNTQVANVSANAPEVFEENLQPYTFYSYVVEAVNDFGSTFSTPVVFQTLPGEPTTDMVLTVTDIRARSAYCSWTLPSFMNGPLEKYVILSSRNGENSTVEEWEGTEQVAILTALSPYTRYELRVRACTVGGCADSEGVKIITLSAPPEGQKPPEITALSSSELSVSWAPPILPNGIISFYELWMRGPLDENGQYNPAQARIFHPSGRYDPLNPPEENPLDPPATSYNVSGLLAFTTYEFQVLSQNDAGKAASIWRKGPTEEALPVTLNPPLVMGTSSTELSVKWEVPAPEDVRGLVEKYRVYQNVPRDLVTDPFGPPYVWKVVYEGDGAVLSHFISGLTPYSEHSIILEACNGKGCINSTAVTGRTLLAAPEGVQKPSVGGFNTTVMEIQWEPPIFPNGPPPLYKVEKTNIALSFPASVVRGTRFTGGGYYAFPPTVFPQNVAFTGIRFKFRLKRGTGILLFTASSTQEEFVSVQFVNGRPRFLFDTQGNCNANTGVDFDLYTNWTSLVNTGVHEMVVRRNGNDGIMVIDGYFVGCRYIASVTTTNDEGLTYNDGKWHSFEARRSGSYGNVTVDNVWKGQSFILDASCRDTSIIGPTTGVYVGGFPPDFVLRRTDRTRKVETSSLQGCIDNVEILQQIYPEEVWTSLNWAEGLTNDLAFLNWQGCPINLQPGFHFMGKGFLILDNCNKGSCHVGGDNIQIRFRMRTALHTGLLFLLHGGTGTYLYGVLDNDNLRFVVSGNGIRTDVNYASPGQTFCDGKWRTLIFEKSGQQVSISIPNAAAFSQGNASVSMPLTLTSHINLGGLKPGSDASVFVQDSGLSIPSEGFGGCFSGLEINDINFEAEMTIIDVANTNLDGCPPYNEPEDTCQSSLITEVYEGKETVAYETGLLPYTDYIYRVVASNEAGSGRSSWGYGRTREGAPSGVHGPSSLRAISGQEIEVIWDKPDITYGLLTKFVIKAYVVDSAESDFVSMETTDVSVTAVNMSNVVADTKYNVKIEACTPGGCTESEEGMEVTTPIEAPSGVPAPTAQIGTSFLFVQWDPPSEPNGPITGYFLYQDGREIYRGGKLSFNSTGLQVYTTYKYYILACTSADCSEGPAVSISTAQLPPTAVDPPSLLVLDTSSIKVTWLNPSHMNGLLESFHLYASTEKDQLGDVAYNSTVLIQNYVIERLLAGTTYYITLGACTGGGCTLSPASSATTEESAPSGVSTPVVEAKSPFQLIVTWDAPQFPNGEIVRYVLYQNGATVYTGLLRSYSSSGLQPYSLHAFQVQACTVEGCAFSDEVQARTFEIAPNGVIVLTATVIDARTVNVSWTLPDKPNGKIIFRVYFAGLFYADVGSWNYTTIQDRRAVLQEETSFLEYQVQDLVPLSSYSVEVNGSNSVGFILSNAVELDLPPSYPDGMAPPDLVSETPDSIRATWEPVGRVNAEEVPAYRLQFMETKDGASVQDEFGPTVTLNYVKTGLLAYTEYKFRIAAINSYGMRLSPWASLVTRQDKPSSINVPFVLGVRARYVDITWSSPLAPNGILMKYNVYYNQQLAKVVAGNVTSLRVDNLQPFTYYTFVVEACTIAGCTPSLPSSTVQTLEDIPQEMTAPELTALSQSTIEITWGEPGKPNGILSQYIIERKEISEENFTIVAIRLADLVKIYTDESNDLLPFSNYNYRVNAQNGAGVGIGPGAVVTTTSARPAGVQPPRITSINSTTVLVQWSEPIQSNGKLESYFVRFPTPSIEVKDTSQQSLVVNDLIAYTNYAVTLTVCTDGGCTESSPTRFTTIPSIPFGQSPPNPVAISQSRISVSWQPPSLPNGPSIQYELSRKKVRQLLNTSATDIGVWKSIYKGESLFYQDQGLPLFTTYVYQVTVFNNVSQASSEESVEATTFGGVPKLPANVDAVTVDHLRISVNWTLPDPVDLQGEIQSLTLQAQSLGHNVTVFPETEADVYVIDDLQPSTEYAITLTVTIYGGASVTSEITRAKTKDGAPTGLAPPRLSVVSNTALSVAWTAPSNPNGEITAYNILVNDRKITTGSTLPRTVVVMELEPFTVYDFRVEACTIYACTISESTFGTTTEAPPQGLTAPFVNATSATEVLITWGGPTRPNGIIQRYDVWRKTLQSCATLPAPTVDPELQKCTYIECGVFETLCGTVCYSGQRVCCNGQLHDSKADFACCGQDYILKAKPDYVCCAGKFYPPEDNYQCCGHRYIQVLPGQYCCSDPQEDRVSISQGDACCGSLPYLSTGAQMCCKGKLLSKIGLRCCGGEVISDTTVCCGDSAEGRVHLPLPGHSCCGLEYVEENTTLCCASDTGHTEVHFYENAEEKLQASDKCCGLSRITNNLGCCNYVGYDTLTQVCADQSGQQSGCGTGTVCPLSQKSTAYCDRCNFDTTSKTCGHTQSYQEASIPTPDPASTCATQTEIVYSGLNLIFYDTGLIPFSQYEYSVRAINNAGSAVSEYAAVRTKEAAPTGVLAPTTNVAPGQLFVIYLFWDPPQNPNGEITEYALKRDGIEVYRGLNTNFTDDLKILPYTSYSYILSACNQAGCSHGPTATVATAQATPEDLQPPVIDEISAVSLRVRGQPPGRPNGVVLAYRIRVLELSRSYNSTVPQEFIVRDLTPFTTYTLDQEVCTAIGCARSRNITVTTEESSPQGLNPPRLVVISTEILELYWQPPLVSNGIIQNYEVIQAQPFPVASVYRGVNTNLRLSGLTAGQTYTFQLEASNSVGTTRSSPVDIIMPLDTPVNVPPPQLVRVLSASSIQVRWQPLPPEQGNIDQYRVLMNIGLDTEVERGTGLQTSVTVSDLKPYTEYEVRLQACFRNVLNGCGTSSGVIVRTKESAPSGMKPPQLVASSFEAIQISWEAVDQPNGIITNYRIYQRAARDESTGILINQVDGSVFTFLHSGKDLNPYTEYEFKVEAVNSEGVAESEWSLVRTLQAAPTGLSPPVVESVSAYGVSLTWKPPDNPNGPIQEYRIFFHLNSPLTQKGEDHIRVEGTTLKTAIGGLEAFSKYTIYLEAMNGNGSVRSSSVSFSTREGFPSGLPDFIVEKVSTGTSVILTWTLPKKTNGDITVYRIYQGNSSVAIYNGVARLFEFIRLTPYTEYFVKLEACTKGGCTLGKVQSFITAEVSPTAQPSPSFGDVNATMVQIIWEPPLFPNGKIISYEVLRRGRALRKKRNTNITRCHFSYRNFEVCFSNTGFENENYLSKSLDLGHKKTDVLTMANRSVLSQTVGTANIVRISNTHLFGRSLDYTETSVTRVKRQTPDPEIVYRTTNTEHDSYEYIDTDLKPYTEYQYSIRASNAQAYTDSPWQTVKTQQAAPEGVEPPLLSHVPDDISSILVTWSIPSQPNGVLQGYQIQRNNSVPFSFPPQGDQRFLDSGLVAYTVYSYRMTACTGGGCSTSEPAFIRTIEAAPLSVNPPQIEPINSSALEASWAQPVISNGKITHYQLKMDGQIVYSGLSLSFTVTNLIPFEKRVFTITACTAGGCTESGEVEGHADDAPPVALSPPLLRVMSSKSIEITWSPPSRPNGIISSYDLRRDGRLIYTTSINLNGDLKTFFTDFSLEPGIMYSYTVIARNRKGSVESLPAQAMTYSASPSGLSPPTLTPQSSTSILATWTPPGSPNGVLTNYTLYQGIKIVYSGPPFQLSYTVPGLGYYTQYDFRMEACTSRGCEVSRASTARTLAAQPENQPPPSLVALGDEFGAHAGVRVSWEAPAKPNGVISGYELQRRLVQESEGTEIGYGTPELVINGSNTVYTDNDPRLRPYTHYQYMVIAVNSVGKAGSPWVSVRTKEGAPENIPLPTINSRSSTSIVVTAQAPAIPNGEIRMYKIMVNNSVASSSPSPQQTVGLSSPLSPYTTYELKVQACTSGGCGSSEGIIVITDSAKPLGLKPVSVLSVTNDSVVLQWYPPDYPNGIILRYEVYKKVACPATFQPFDQSCVPGDIEEIYSGLDLSHTSTDLFPYTAYEFQVQVFNDKGGMDFPIWVRAETADADPVYIHYPQLFKNGTMAMISWEGCFALNGRLREFILLADGQVIFRGIDTVHGIERQSKNQVIKFIIQVITYIGQTESPVIVFDPNADGNIGTTLPPASPDQTSKSIALYEEIWFIVLMCLLALLVLFIILALCVRYSGPREPYIRERMPLQRPHSASAMRDMFVVNARDGSRLHIDGLPPESITGHDHFYQGPGLGIINPAFSQNGDLGKVPTGRLSRVSSRYADEELRWGKPYDSGLFDVEDGEDYDDDDDDDNDSSSHRTYSYTKEQTVFTDTHI